MRRAIVALLLISGTLSSCTRATPPCIIADPGILFVQQVVYEHGIVYLSGRAGTLYALDAQTGKTLWQQPIGRWGFLSQVALDDTHITIADLENITAMNKTTGQIVWKVQYHRYPLMASQPIMLALNAGILYAVTPDVGVSAYSEDTGQLLWSLSLPAIQDGATPIINDNTLYIGSDAVYAIDIHTHQLIWKHQDPGFSLYTTPLVAHQEVLVGATHGSGTTQKRNGIILEALQQDTGQPLWSQAYNGGGVLPLAIDQNTLVTVSFPVDRTNDMLLRQSLDGKEHQQIALSLSVPNVENPSPLRITSTDTYIMPVGNDAVAEIDSNGLVLWRVQLGTYGFISLSDIDKATVYGSIWGRIIGGCGTPVTAVEATPFALSIDTGKVLWLQQKIHDKK